MFGWVRSRFAGAEHHESRTTGAVGPVVPPAGDDHPEVLARALERYEAARALEFESAASLREGKLQSRQYPALIAYDEKILARRRAMSADLRAAAIDAGATSDQLAACDDRLASAAEPALIDPGDLGIDIEPGWLPSGWARAGLRTWEYPGGGSLEWEVARHDGQRVEEWARGQLPDAASIRSTKALIVGPLSGVHAELGAPSAEHIHYSALAAHVGNEGVIRLHLVTRAGRSSRDHERIIRGLRVRIGTVQHPT